MIDDELESARRLARHLLSGGSPNAAYAIGGYVPESDIQVRRLRPAEHIKLPDQGGGNPLDILGKLAGFAKDGKKAYESFTAPEATDPQQATTGFRSEAADAERMRRDQPSAPLRSEAAMDAQPQPRVTPGMISSSDDDRRLSGVDPRLHEIMTEAAKRSGYNLALKSGLRPGDKRFHGRGLATDWNIIGDDGKPLADYQSPETFAQYQKLADAAREVQTELYPDLSDQFRWGGYFSGPKGKYGALDLMHFDLGGSQDLGMAGGTWDGGLTEEQAKLWGLRPGKMYADGGAVDGGALDKARADEARERAGGQVAPSKYMPDVPRQVHADGGSVRKEKWHADSHPLTKGEDGNPKNLYHGTTGDFSKFKVSNTGEFGPGVYLTDLPEEASDYAGTHRGGQNVMPVYARLRNPFVVKSDPAEFWDKFHADSDEEAVFAAMQAGHDGVIYSRPHAIWDDKRGLVPTGKVATHYVVFNPDGNIKSAIGNNGDFDMKNPDITKAEGGSVDGAHLLTHKALSHVFEQAERGGYDKVELPEEFAPHLKPGLAKEASETHVSIDVHKPVKRADGGRTLNELGLYSRAAEIARGLPQEKGGVDQMLAMLRKGGAKPAELDNAGRPSGDKIDRETLARHFEEKTPKLGLTKLGKSPSRQDMDYEDRLLLHDLGEGDHPGERPSSPGAELPTKFSQYTTPGGENYREHLITLPSAGGGSDYKSSHWDQPNVVAHVRMKDRTGPNGEKILHVEEIQSDWGQDARKNGFQPSDDEVNSIIERMQDATASGSDDEYNRLRREEYDPLQTRMDKGVPAAPYIGNTQHWTDLALKHVLGEAAKGGYDKMAWTPGQQQAERYGLANHVNELRYDPSAKNLAFKSVRGGPMNAWHDDVEPHQIGDIIGREAAERLLAAPQNQHGEHVLIGEDLKFGGDGMKSYYDKIVPSRLKALTGKVPSDFEGLPSIDMDDELRNNILEGQPAFRSGGIIRGK